VSREAAKRNPGAFPEEKRVEQRRKHKDWIRNRISRLIYRCSRRGALWEMLRPGGQKRGGQVGDGESGL